MSNGYLGQRVLTPEDLGAIPIPDTVNHVVGSTATLLTRPAGCRAAPGEDDNYVYAIALQK